LKIDTSVKVPEIKVEDENFVIDMFARSVENVKIAESPKWLSARLEAIGARFHQHHRRCHQFCDV